jgi:hypothetical protein
MPTLIPEVLVSIDPLGDLGFCRLSQPPLGAVAQNARQHVTTRRGWQCNDLVATLSHGGVLLGNLA